MENDEITCPECNGDGWLIYWQGKRGANDPCGSEVQDDCDKCFGTGLIENPIAQQEGNKGRH